MALRPSLHPAPLGVYLISLSLSLNRQALFTIVSQPFDVDGGGKKRRAGTEQRYRTPIKGWTSKKSGCDEERRLRWAGATRGCVSRDNFASQKKPCKHRVARGTCPRVPIF